MSSNDIIDSSYRKLAILLCFVCLFAKVFVITGCAATFQEFSGIQPTDLEFIYPGMRQEDVDRTLGKPEYLITTDDSYTAVYPFNRGLSPYINEKKRKWSATWAFLDVSYHDYQEALLYVLYDKNKSLVYAEEELDKSCGSTRPKRPVQRACEKARHRLYPPTLPLEVTKRYQLATPELKALYKRVEETDPEARTKFYKINSALRNQRDLDKEIGAYCPNADLGHADSQKYIGDLYTLGFDRIKVDLVQAYVWYSLAANAGDVMAEKHLGQVISVLTEEQLLDAEQRLKNWVPGQCRHDLLKAESGSME